MRLFKIWLTLLKYMYLKLILFTITLHFVLVTNAEAQEFSFKERKLTIESHGWKLVGELCIPNDVNEPPAVIMLNKAAGNRTVYKVLAIQLAKRGIASLRLDLRGHGESINLGRFVPGEVPKSPMIWEADEDVVAAHNYLKTYKGINKNRIGMVGGSYSGEEMAEAGRLNGYAQAYVELSPGSFSDESINSMDTSGVPWLFIASNNERHLKEITAEVQLKSKATEMLILPGKAHATNMLKERPELAEQIAVWLAYHLK